LSQDESFPKAIVPKIDSRYELFCEINLHFYAGPADQYFMKNLIHMLVAVLLFPWLASAQITRSADIKQNRAFVYTGKLVRPDGSTPNGNISVSLKIFSPDPSLCLLWGEVQTVELKKGGFSLELGHAVNRLTGSSGGIAVDFKQVFVNNSSLTLSPAQCDSGTSYTPAAIDDRLLTATFNDSGNIVEIAGLPIKSVPFALQTEEIAGFGIANLAKISGSGSSVTYTPEEVQTLKDMLGGDIHFDMKGRQLKNLAAPVDPNDAATKAWVSSQISSSGGGTVSEVFATAPLTVTNGTSTPLVSMSAANGSTDGYLTSANFTTFSNKLSAVAGHTLSDGMTWIGNGSNQAAARLIRVSDVRSTAGGGTGAFLGAAGSCPAGQSLQYVSAADRLECVSYSLATNAVASGSITDKAVTYAKIQDLSTNNRILGRSTAGAGVVEEITVGAGLSLSAGTLTATSTGSGTVTSVGLGVPSFMTAGADITTSGDIALSFSDQAQNAVFAGPATGGSGAVSFRALAAADAENFRIVVGSINLRVDVLYS